MKKIISIFAAVALLMSSTVFAAGYIPTGCTDPKANVSCVKTSGPDGDGYYDYELTIDLSDMGNLSHTLSSRKVTGAKINYVGIELRGDKSMETAKTSITGNLGDASVFSQTLDYVGVDASGVNITYISSDGAAAYPKEGTTSECKGAIKLAFYSKAGNITLSNAKIGFLYFDEGVGGETGFLPLTLNKTSFTIGAEEPKNIAIAAEGVLTTDTGCIWNVDLTNASKINKFDATFKATGAEEAKRTVRNISDLVSAVGGTGSLNLKVGVVTDTTTKSNITACFDVADSDGKTATTGDIVAAAKSE